MRGAIADLRRLADRNVSVAVKGVCRELMIKVRHHLCPLLREENFCVHGF
jgi:hypothetical protein